MSRRICDRHGVRRWRPRAPGHDDRILTQPSATVFGRASDNLGVASLAVNGQPVGLKADGTSRPALELPLGNSRITVTATNGVGQQASATTDVTVVETLTQPKSQRAAAPCRKVTRQRSRKGR